MDYDVRGEQRRLAAQIMAVEIVLVELATALANKGASQTVQGAFATAIGTATHAAEQLGTNALVDAQTTQTIEIIKTMAANVRYPSDG